MDCPSCGSANTEGSKICSDCGAPLPVRCAVCGAENPSSKRFCGDCGAALMSTGGARASAAARTSTPTVPPVAEPSALPPPQSSSAERRQLTVMFCDLVGSTALAAQLDPEDLREIIAAYRDGVAAIVRKYGGTISRYIGDGLLILLGHPWAHEDDAESAVRAALEIAATGHAPGAPPGLELRVRLGLATGLAIVGDLIGSEAAEAQAVVGETPNLAARLQALAEPDGVVIAEDTRRLIGGLFDYQDLGEVTLKGFAAPVRAWRVLREGTAESRFAAMHAAALTPLAGREEEPGVRLDKLRAVLSPASPPDEDVAILADLLSIPTGDGYPPIVPTPQRKKEKSFDALARQLEGLAWRHPIMMVFEDAQWIDPSSRELLDRAVER